MIYNYLFDIASIAVLILVFYDYKVKTRVYRTDGNLFKFVIISSLVTSFLNVTSSVLIEYANEIPRWVNVFAATLFFISQATMIYSLSCFSFYYINSRFGVKKISFWILTSLFVGNIIISILSPFTGWYFSFNSSVQYIQGPLSDLGYYLYYINVVLCFLYAMINRHHILKKDLMASCGVAIIVCIGVTLQFVSRSVLVIDFAMMIAVLYLYMTLENPNDYQDKLTHCTNNYGFKIFINSKSNSSKPFTVMFLDVKKFRYINTIYGVEMGNFLLQQIVIYLESEFKNHLVFRINDDVFAVEISGAQEQIKESVERVQKRFENVWVLPDLREVKLNEAMVVCEYPRHFSNHTELLELRNYMMSKVKAAHNCHVLYADVAVVEKYRRRELVEQALSNALNDNTLQVYYQPIFDSDTKTITTAEALSRLTDSKLGAISPDEFIAVAEGTGLIIKLGFYVLEKVCSFIETKLLTDSKNTIKNIHVNMSVLQCAYPLGNSKYLEIIKSHNVPPDMIHFELTESSMVESPDIVRATMDELIETGIHFSLDDYGTGFSNISYLVQFPFDKVKFDKHMVWIYFENPTAQTIMKNEFSVFNLIGKDIVVEGIETKEQYETLCSQNIHLFQGYYFSCPVPSDECISVMHKWADKPDN